MHRQHLSLRSRRAALVVITLLTACATQDQNTGRNLYVEPAPDGEWDDATMVAGELTFTTIQDAVDAASAGDTVVIPSGTYTEQVTMAEGVHVDGAGIGETLVVGGFEFVGFTTETILSDVSVFDTGYATGGTSYTYDLIVISGGDATIRDVGAFYGRYGIYAYYADEVTVDGARLGANWYGANALTTAQFDISNSFVYSGGIGGIVTYGSTGGNIYNNTVIANGYAGASTGYLTGGISSGSGGSEAIYNNIMTSNYYGLNCASCTASWGNNLVWGNATDYVNDASAAGSDLSADPQFNDPSEGDYSLHASSPCIDAGNATYYAATDKDGEARPQGSGVDIGFDEYATSTYDLILSEIMANPSNETTGEFVEIYNAGTTSVDLAGLIITDGDADDTIEAWSGGSTTLAAGEYAVVIDTDYASDYTIDSAVTVVVVDDSRIGNGMTTSDEVTLYESDGSTVIASFSFPEDPGNGVSLEMVDLTTGDTAGNYRASQCTSTSSPGAEHCFPESGDPAGLVITEVMANAVVESTGEYIEIYNPTTTDIDLAGLIFEDGSSTDTIQSYQSGTTLLPAGAHALLIDSNYTYDYYLPTDVVLVTTGDSTLGNGLSTSDSVYLYLSDGSTLIDSFTSPTNPGNGVSSEKIDYAAGDTSSNWAAGDGVCSRGASPARLNGQSGGICAPILITEVQANAGDEDTGEFIELYNAGGESIDLAGLMFTDGDADDTIQAYDGGSTVLVPGGYAVIVDAEFASDFTIDSAAIVVTTGDTTLGNSLSISDDVILYEDDGVSLIDAFTYPTNPGNAISIERVSYAGTLDSATNWEASTCAANNSAGADNCVGTSTTGGGVSAYEIFITEIMSNADDEDTGEFIELYNNGTTDVDLINFAVYDGDAVDTIIGFSSYFDTVLPAGGYAVILDQEYAGEYTIPSGALLLTTDDTTVCSGLATTDPVYLYESDVATLVDSFSFPSNPGNGVSIERIDPVGEDISTNWDDSVCSTGSSPGQLSCP
jgi:hypothetical protein